MNLVILKAIWKFCTPKKLFLGDDTFLGGDDESLMGEQAGKAKSVTS